MNRRLWPRTIAPTPLVTHFILADYGNLGLAFDEVEPGLSFSGVIDKIAERDKVVAVFCADEEAGTWRDVTSDVADYLARQPWDEIGSTAQDLVRSHGLAPDEQDEEADELDGYSHQRREVLLMGHFE